MSKFEYLNLTQKMIKIRKMVPKLIRKRYSEEVPYDFVRLDDIYEYLTPALTKYGVDFEVLTEKPTQVDSSGNQVYLIPFGNLWRYEADLKLCWVNADRPNEKSYSDIHVVGTNEVPDKAKGAAWSYGLKYYLLNKFNIVQATTEDPDMRGPAPDGDKTKKEKTQNKGENTKPDLSPKKTVSVTNAVKSEPKKKEAKEKPEHPPKSGSAEASAEEIGQSLKRNEKLTSKTVRNGNAVSGKQTVKISEDSFDLEISPDEIRDLQDNDDNLPGQMQFGMEEKNPEEKNPEKNFLEDDDFKKKVSAFEEGAFEEMTNETVCEEEKVTGNPVTGAEPEEVFEETDQEEEEFHLVSEEDENPFDDEKEEETAEDFPMDSEEDDVEKAKKVICNFGLFSGMPLGEILYKPDGPKTLRWMGSGYKGSNNEMREAAKIIMDYEDHKKIAA